jgi:hypothetical protein
MKFKSLSISLAVASLLAGCGGGGGDGSAFGGGTSNDEAAVAAANGTLMASDATTALDTGVMAAQAVVATQAAAAVAGEDRATALASPGNGESVAAQVLVNVPVSCAGGGSATLSLSGGSAGSLLNGQFDAGEVYALQFTNCKSSSGAASVNGSLSLTVLAAGTGTATLQLTATQLVVALPRGTVTINGSSTRQITASSGDAGTTTVSSHYTASSLAMATQFNGRSSTFTLSAVDITRQATWLAGVLQSSSLSGTHTLAATLAGGSFSHTVATQGSVSYGANGLPSAGSWTVTLPLVIVGITVANGVVTITIDEGKNGSIDRTFTINISRLQNDAG